MIHIEHRGDMDAATLTMILDRVGEIFTDYRKSWLTVNITGGSIFLREEAPGAVVSSG